MLTIQYPMKVHAVKLEYRRQKLEAMAKGYYRSKNNVNKVHITFDPDNSKGSFKIRS